ncbi:MAG TPA: hypothetical protein VHF58_05700 [Solirubrobacterales bacterium]|nr:hypothetical protein [Solirubrobacterales bacterium]
MHKASRKPRLALLGLLTAFAVTVPAGSASAVELEGPWAPFDHCPVDDPQMLAVTNSGNACVSSVSPRGSFKIGNTTVPTGRTELQFGATGPGIPDVIAPGYLNADPVKVPGGLLGLMCPANLPLVTQVCNTLVDNPLNRVTATVELAGAVSDFDLFAAVLGGPVVTLPVKIHLRNPLLGGNCYIGSNADPIVLKPEQEPPANTVSFADDPLGSPATFITPVPETGTLVDDSFTVPRAKGCGLLNLFDGAVNGKLGLPSPAGANKLVQEEAAAKIVGNAPSGQALSDAWHAAVISG